MSVVGSEFDQLKRFNLAELRDAANETSHKDPDTASRSLEQSSAKTIEPSG